MAGELGSILFARGNKKWFSYFCYLLPLGGTLSDIRCIYFANARSDTKPPSNANCHPSWYVASAAYENNMC